jgi:hypothetical protein
VFSHELVDVCVFNYAAQFILSFLSVFVQRGKDIP